MCEAALAPPLMSSATNSGLAVFVPSYRPGWRHHGHGHGHSHGHVHGHGHGHGHWWRHQGRDGLVSDLTVGADGKADKVLIAEQGLALHLLVPRSERVGQAFHLVSRNNNYWRNISHVVLSCCSKKVESGCRKILFFVSGSLQKQNCAKNKKGFGLNWHFW